VFWIWAERSVSMRSAVAIRAKPSKRWPATAAPELAKDPETDGPLIRPSGPSTVEREDTWTNLMEELYSFTGEGWEQEQTCTPKWKNSRPVLPCLADR
jgi:hypothetical protein